MTTEEIQTHLRTSAEAYQRRAETAALQSLRAERCNHSDVQDRREEAILMDGMASGLREAVNTVGLLAKQPSPAPSRGFADPGVGPS